MIHSDLLMPLIARNPGEYCLKYHVSRWFKKKRFKLVQCVGSVMIGTDVQAFLDLSLKDAVSVCMAWLKDTNDGALLEVEDPMDCPIALWVAHNGKCSREFVPNTTSCPVCGSPACPDGMNHHVDQLSRVTGYMQVVSGWNAAKKQELKDRKKYDLGNEGMNS